MEAISCVFDDDKGVVTLEYDNERKPVVIVNALEGRMGLASAMESRLVWLLCLVCAPLSAS